MRELHKAMEIYRIQNKVKELGYQWREHIFNDGFSNDCYLELHKSTDPDALEKSPELGWGRFPRLECWNKVENYIKTLEYLSK